MERESAKTLFPESSPNLVNPQAMSAGGQVTPMAAGKVVTPRQFVRQVLTEALHELGGISWVVNFAKANDGNARIFFQGITKLLPIELSGADGAPLQIIIRQEGGESRSARDIGGVIIDGVFVANPGEERARVVIQPEHREPSEVT